ncbi:MAG TPA: hypothetical protein VMR21_08945, partial [Vicinamibacteria bacterium]|nr:hypothetical protein [Vicinamibacteria bacterium]
EWAKLWSGLRQIGHPAMALYMPPGPTTGTPMLLASHDEPPALGPIRPLSPETRGDFLAQAAAGADFAFLVQSSPSTPELDWRSRHLRSLGYRRVRLPVFGAQAQLFSRRGPPPFARVTRLAGAATAAGAVRWARARLQDGSRRPPGPSGLGLAVVARVEKDGTVHESTFFASQRGESGYWRIGPADRDAVAEEQVWTGRGHTEMVVARAREDSLVVIAFPGLDTGGGLRLRCRGVATRGRPRGVEVLAELFVGDEPAAAAVCPGHSGAAAEVRVAAPPGRAGRTDVTVLLTALGGNADVAFRLDPSRVVPPAAGPAAPAPPITLAGGRALSASLERLEVYRTNRNGFGRVPSRLETSEVSAADLHERGGSGPEGALAAHWRLGGAPWDAVGRTVQRSGGETRSGLWAHPRAGTTLVIEAEAVRLARVLEGFYGLTDHAVEQGRLGRIPHPVHLRVFLDGAVVLAAEAPRTAGWRHISVPLAHARPEGRVRVEVTSDRDTWAHFVFDLWSR